MNSRNPMTTRIPFGAARPMTYQAGLTILELMISMSLGLLLVVGIGTVYVGSNQTYRVQEDHARIQENGRYTLEAIGRSLRQAGYADIPISPIATKTSFTGTAISGLDTACPPTGTKVTDVLTVQYDGIAGEKDCQDGTIAAGEFVQHTYYVDNNVLRCKATRGATAPTPPTACPAAGTGIQLVPNVEDLQILYGIDTDTPGTPPPESADQYVAAPTAAQRPQVVSARVCVRIRSDNIGISGTAQRYLNCDGALGISTGAAAFTTAADSRLRRTFVATFNLRNRVNTTQ